MHKLGNKLIITLPLWCVWYFCFVCVLLDIFVRSLGLNLVFVAVISHIYSRKIAK